VDVFAAGAIFLVAYALIASERISRLHALVDRHRTLLA
jgi:hypothetical protein